MKAIDIAKWFVLKANAEMKEFENDDYVYYESMTHLKVQKLLYYAQGIYLSLSGGQPLFEESILAWQHGPVVAEVYEDFKVFGRDPIMVEINDDLSDKINAMQSDCTIHEALELTYDNFAGYTAWQLRNMTHEALTPWDLTNLNEVIENSLIKDYFDDEIME